MRIISGSNKGTQIKPPSSFKARPTTDQAREGLFNILSNQYDFEEIKVADLFGGTGAISFEFASRGVKEIFCIEIAPAHFRFINKNTKELGFGAIKTFRTNAFNAIQKLPKKHFDLIFADPPFDLPNKSKIIEDVMEANVLNNGILILEHSDKENFNQSTYFIEQRNYGKVCFSFFKDISQ